MSELPVEPAKEGPKPQELVDKLVDTVFDELPHKGMRKRTYSVGTEALSTRALLSGLIDPDTRVPDDVEVKFQSHYELAAGDPLAEDALKETPSGIHIIDPSRGDPDIFWPPYDIGTYAVNIAPKAPPEEERIHRFIPHILGRNESGTPNNTRQDSRQITAQERHDLEQLVRDFGDETDLQKAILKLSTGDAVSQYALHSITDENGHHDEFSLTRDMEKGEPTAMRLKVSRRTPRQTSDGKPDWDRASEEWKFDKTGLISYAHDLGDDEPFKVDFTKDTSQKDFYAQNAATALADILSKKDTYIAQQPPPSPFS